MARLRYQCRFAAEVGLPSARRRQARSRWIMLRIGGRFVIGACDSTALIDQVPAIIVSVSGPTDPAPRTQALTSIIAATTGVPVLNPVSSAAVRDTCPAMPEFSTISGTRLANSGTPAVSKSASL